MKKIDQPNFSLKDVLDVCLESDHRAKSVNEIIPNLRPLIEGYADIYEQNAVRNEFHLIDAIFNMFHIHMSSDELTYLDRLYEYRFRERKDGRYFYNQIIDNVKTYCPYCNHGEISQIDHYIPQAKYSLCNIHPKNLIPICANCNKDKDDFVGTDEGTNLLHPYYDDLDRHQWLFAEVVASDGICKYEINYYCRPSIDVYSPLEIERLKNNFINMKFSERFRRIARSYSRTIENQFKNKNDDICRLFVKDMMDEKTVENGKNHWLVALYQAFLSYSGSLDDFR